MLPNSLRDNRVGEGVRGHTETLLESAPFINFGIPQANVFSSSTQEEGAAILTPTGPAGKDKTQLPGMSGESGQQPLGPHREALTCGEQILAHHTEVRTRD